MVFVDPYLLSSTLVMTILLILGNIYFLAHYAHHADSFFGSSTACKAVLVSIWQIIFNFNTVIVDRWIHIGSVSGVDAAIGCAEHEGGHQLQDVFVLAIGVHGKSLLYYLCLAIWTILFRDKWRERICKSFAPSLAHHLWLSICETCFLTFACLLEMENLLSFQEWGYYSCHCGTSFVPKLCIHELCWDPYHC